MDNVLANFLLQKLDSETFDLADFQDYLQIFCEICNENQYIQNEIKDWNLIIQWSIGEDKSYYIQFLRGLVSITQVNHKRPSLIIKMTSIDVMREFENVNEIDAIFRNEKLMIDGSLDDAIRFRLITEIVREEFENIRPEYN